MQKISIIEGEYVRDILNQPKALKDTLKGLKESAALKDLANRHHKGEFQRIVLTGMGSSFHALYPLNLQLLEHGFNTVAAETSELVHYMPRLVDRGSLIIVVSQSGSGAEVLRLMEVNRRSAAILAVTNTPDSPLARHADASVLTRAGEESSVSTKTYVTAMMALESLGATLCGSDHDQIARELALAGPAVESYLSNWQGHVERVSAELHQIRHLFLVGRGASMAAAATGALIIKESTHFHAEGMSSAAFRHGPFELTDGGAFVLVFLGDARTAALNRNLGQDLLNHGGRTKLVSEEESNSAFCLPSVPPRVRPIVEILPAQIISLALAAQAGREAGRLTLSSKVTTIE
jgi:glucosamine--fructose-6-phosphate aminotransferase (isomerizing)